MCWQRKSEEATTNNGQFVISMKVGLLLSQLFVILVASGCAPEDPMQSQYFGGGDGRHFMLLRSVTYRIPITGKAIKIPAGFVTDFASVPSSLQSLVSVTGPQGIGAIVHDFLYWDQGCTREEADEIFIIAMRENYVEESVIKRIALGLRIGGNDAWEKNARDRQKGLVKIVPEDKYSNITPTAAWDEFRQSLFTAGVRPKPKTNAKPEYCDAKSNLKIGLMDRVWIFFADAIARF